MSLPGDYNKALYKKANFYAAWFPVAMPYSLGDYGLISNGVFQKTGHLNDLEPYGFQVKIEKKQGNPTSLDFLSEGVTTSRVVAGANVSSLTGVPGNAKITYEFANKNSFVVKAAVINVEVMTNIEQIAKGLALLRRENKWSHSHRVVHTTYTGQNCLVLMATEAGTKVEFEAQAKAIEQLDLGNVNAQASVSFSSNTFLKSIGESGVLGLGLFKLGFFMGGLQLLGEAELREEEKKIEKDWGGDLANDL